MAMVLKFPLERVTRPSTKQSSGNEAKILLFEGVRYLAGGECADTLAKMDKA